MKTTTDHRRFFQPYAPWLLALALVAWLASCVPAQAQCPLRLPTAAELARWVEAQAAAEAAAKAERHARHAPARARVAKARLARIKTRLAKLDRRIGGWEDELPGLRGRIGRLQRSPKVRNSTMRRRLGSLIADVRRKIAQREEWIAAARREERALLDERQAQIDRLVEAERSIQRRKGG